METALHRQLKSWYALSPECEEVWIGEFRVDAFRAGHVYEIQQGSLALLRRKTRVLLADFPVTVVKPLACEKTIFRWNAKRTKVESCRRSPKHETPLDLFDDLVHFVDIFPSAGLTIELVLGDLEEDRVPAIKRRRRSKDYRVIDRRMVTVRQQVALRSTADLLGLLPPLPEQFTTQELAELTELPRWKAQKIAYCLRKTGAVDAIGKRKHSWLYAIAKVEPEQSPVVENKTAKLARKTAVTEGKVASRRKKNAA